MSKIAILTDSSCDIPQEMAEKYGIDIMSFHILLDNVDYVERESCTNTEFYDKMRAAKGVPSTAAITPIQFCEKYCQYVDEGYTDVIHVPINKSGSSTYNNALMAQGMLREERPEHHLNIHLLDPHTYSMVFGWYLCEMARKLKNGAEISADRSPEEGRRGDVAGRSRQVGAPAAPAHFHRAGHREAAQGSSGSPSGYLHHQPRERPLAGTHAGPELEL